MKDGIVTAIYVDKDGVADKAELDKNSLSSTVPNLLTNKLPLCA